MDLDQFKKKNVAKIDVLKTIISHFKEEGLTIIEQKQLINSIISEINPKKQAKEKVEIAPKEEIEKAKEIIDAYKNELYQNSKKFSLANKSEVLSALKRLKDKDLNFKSSNPSLKKLVKAAQEIAYKTDYASLKSINEVAWNALQLGSFSISYEVKKTLESYDFTKEELLVLLELLTIGKPLSKSKKGFEDAIATESSWRANTR